MGYPSLLYAVQPKLRAMSGSVFEDLQLFNFFPRETARTVKLPCEPANIVPRQALFRSLSAPENLESFRRLQTLSEAVCDADRSLREARCDAERDAVFLALYQAKRSFGEAAADAGFGDPLSDTFSACFRRELQGELCQKASAEADILYPGLTGILCPTFRFHGQEIALSGKETGTCYDRIGECAEQLGIALPPEADAEKRRLSPDIILTLAKNHPGLFGRLAAFRKAYEKTYDRAVTYYLPELSFYLRMCDFLARIREEGIPLTYPVITDRHQVSVTEAYDVSLLAKNEKHIVPNDISFTKEEPFYYLTGANGGGKTTYLRTVGIALLLYLNGCPLPCAHAEIGGITGIFTHFPRDERFDGSGRFVEENGRVQKILESMDGGSVVLLNETYSTTNEENAVRMTEKLANELYGKGIFGLYITHQHSLAESSIPYLNVLIDREDENRRTFRIARQKSTGGSYAEDILKRYGLTLEALTSRFGAVGEEETK